MINHQIPIVHASVVLDGLGRKKLHVHTPYRPSNLTQDDCVSMHLTKSDQVFTLPPLPIIELPEMADIGRYRTSFDATDADGLRYGDVFNGGLVISSARCMEWGPLLKDFDYANMPVQTIDPSGPVQESYGALSHSVGGLPAQQFGTGSALRHLKEQQCPAKYPVSGHWITAVDKEMAGQLGCLNPSNGVFLDPTGQTLTCTDRSACSASTQSQCTAGPLPSNCFRADSGKVYWCGGGNCRLA